MQPFHGEELAGRHLLEGRCVEDIVSAGNGAAAGLEAADVSDIEFDLVSDIRILGLVLVTHIVLLLLITGEDADFFDVSGQETL